MSTIKIKHVSKNFILNASFIKTLLGKADVVNAVNNVSLTIDKGEIVGLVGESGCGKTTLGKMLVMIEEMTKGEIYYGDQSMSHLKRKEMLELRKDIQMIFQDPFDSLDPKMTVYDIIAEPLRSLKLVDKKEEITKGIITILDQVGLSPSEQYIDQYPHRLSGGQRQRVAIARALIVEPTFIVADEPISMLDVSIRAGILNLLQRINREKDVSILLITHDLATARFLCHRIAVMYLGEIVELISAQNLMNHAAHPYTQLLLSSAPDLFAETSDRIEIKGEAANATAPPKGCRFASRCMFAETRCREEEQVLTKHEEGHYVACWKAHTLARIK